MRFRIDKSEFGEYFVDDTPFCPFKGCDGVLKDPVPITIIGYGDDLVILMCREHFPTGSVEHLSIGEENA